MARWLGWARRHHPLVWWIVGLKLAFALAFTLLVPLFRGPDEAQHVSLLRSYQSTVGSFDPRVPIPMDPGVAAAAGVVDRPAPEGMDHRPPLQEADAPPRGDRVPFGEMAAGPAAGSNGLTQHPPLFYVATNAFTGVAGAALPDGAWSWDRQVLSYRWQAALLSSALVVVASAGALAMGLTRGQAAVAGAFALLVPMHTSIGAMVNNDTFAVAFAGLAVALAVAYLADSSRRWCALAATAAAGAAALSKSTAVLTLPWVLLVVLVPVVAARHDRAAWRRAATTLAWSCAVAAVGASWHLTNLVRYADPQPSRFNAATADRDYPLDVWAFARTWLTRVGDSFWGQPARRAGVTLPTWVSLALTVATVAVVVAGLVLVWRRRRGRSVASLLALLVVVQVALLLRTNWNSYARGRHWSGFQGRYLYALLVPLALLVAIGVRELLAGHPHAKAARVAVGMAGVGVVLHGWLAVRMLTRFWGHDGQSLKGHLDAVRAWSPLPDLATWLVLTGPLLLLAAWLFTTVRRSRGARGPGPDLPRAATSTPEPAG